MNEIKLSDLYAVVDQEFTFASVISRKGRKSITYNPIQDVTRIYSNGFIIYTDVDKERAIEKYNELLV